MAVVNTKMPMLLKVVASSVAIARRSGMIIRGILKGGELGIVDKVTFLNWVPFLIGLSLSKHSIVCNHVKIYQTSTYRILCRDPITGITHNVVSC